MGGSEELEGPGPGPVGGWRSPEKEKHHSSGGRRSQRASEKRRHKVFSQRVPLHMREVGKKEGPCSRRNFKITQFTKVKEWM